MLVTRFARASAFVSLFVIASACSRDGGSAVRATAEPLVPGGRPVTWTGLVNTTVEGDSLVKSGGRPQMEDAGAVSVERVASGEAWFDFTMSETTTFKFVGLGHSATWGGAAAIDFAWRMQSGYVSVWENGHYVQDFTGQTGDVFGIHVVGTTVEYLKNGTPVLTETKTPTYPLIAAASIIDSGGTIRGAELSSAPQSDGGTDPSTPGHHLAGWLAGKGDWEGSAAEDPYFVWFAGNADKFDSVHPTWWSYKPGNDANCCTGGAIFCTGYGNPLAPPACVNDDVPAAAKRAGTKIVPMFAAEGAPVTGMLADPAARQAWAQEIANDATANGYDGVDIDFEHFDVARRDDFTAFMRTLRGLLPQGAVLAVAVQGSLDDAPPAEWDSAALATIADQVEIMGYDFHGLNSSHAGPVDPLGWATDVMKHVRGLNGGATAQKFLWGLPNYGVDGPDGVAGGVTQRRQMGLSWWLGQFAGTAYSNDASAEFASCPFNAERHWTAGLSPNGYMPGGTHAYFDDLDSLAQRVEAAADAGLGGITYWTIGGEANTPNDRFSDYFTMIRHYFPKR